jgi:formiminoglutamase
LPILRRPDDPRLGEVAEFWDGTQTPALSRGQAVVVGFPQDEGVRRNGGRVGAAAAPGAIRERLYSLTPWDPTTGADLRATRLLDLGDVRADDDLESSQTALGDVVAAVLAAGAVPIVLGGGHETAYGHYLGYAAIRRPVSVVNLDAHLDVRPMVDGRGHSGSPFRQMRDHAEHPLPGIRYACLGAQPFSVSLAHAEYVTQAGGIIGWADDGRDRLQKSLQSRIDNAVAERCQIYVSLDADVIAAGEVPGVSAPNPLGLSGHEICTTTRLAGSNGAVSSFELVEINPSLDRDGQSCRLAAAVVWHFLAGLASRPK